MDRIDFSHLPTLKPDTKKAKRYKWQDQCVNLASKLGVPKGLLFKCWQIGGYGLLTRIESDLKEGKPENPMAYILFRIKQWNL